MINKTPLLNLGCGGRFIESWINIDFISDSEFVIQHDLNNGIPLNDSSVDVIYHSHVLEHFTKGKAMEFMKECYRVLKPAGVIRIVVPDLEQIANQYITNLGKVLKDNNELNTENYHWSVIELFDQMLRNQSGGEMGKYWSKKDLINEEYITGRVGYEFKNFRASFLNNAEAKNEKIENSPKVNLLARIRSKVSNIIFKHPNVDWESVKIGKFRSSGEIHQWMYDRYSLKELLESIGFSKITQVTAFTSSIQNWDKYLSLDVENNQVRKPDSLFMEAVK